MREAEGAFGDKARATFKPRMPKDCTLTGKVYDLAVWSDLDVDSV